MAYMKYLNGMIKKYKTYLFIALLATVSGLHSVAQSPTNSPLTIIGLGEIHMDDLHSKGFAGYTSTAAFGDYDTNVRNPAALGRLKSASFDVGVNMKSVVLKHNDLSGSSWHGSFDYLLLSFPIFNPINDILDRDERRLTWGMMLGLKPYSNLGYNIRSDNEIEGDMMVRRHYQGKGGTYKVMWGNGLTYDEFSFGLRLEYILGQMDFRVNSNLVDEPYSFNIRQDKSLYMKAFNYDLGVQYNIVLKRGESVTRDVKGEPIKYINIGLTGSSKMKADFTQDFLNLSISNIGNIVDTISYGKNIRKGGFLPGHVDAGVMYVHNQKLTVSADYSYQTWAQYENPFSTGDNFNLNNSYRFGVGAEFIPDAQALTGYFNRIKYYLGAHYGSDPRVINGHQLVDYGVGTGLTMPFVGRMGRGYATISLFYNHKQASDVKENYFGVGLSFRGTDNQWFLKSKFN